MKRISFLSVMLLLCATMMNAQWRITPEAGVNISKFEGAKAQVGAKIGVGVRYSFNGDDTGWGIRSGLYYIQRRNQLSFGQIFYGKNADGISYVETFSPKFMPWSWGEWVEPAEKVRFGEEFCRMDYLQLPILAQYAWEIAPDIRWHVAAGPYVALGIAGKDKTSYVDWDLKETFEQGEIEFNPFSYKNRFDAGIVAQTGIEVKRVAFLFNYETSLYKRKMRGKSHGVSIGIGYTF